MNKGRNKLFDRAKATGKLDTYLMWIAVAFVVIAIAMPVYLIWRYKQYADYSGLAALGPVGDFIGGSTIAFFNMASIFLLLATLIAQRKELKETRKEYEITNHTMKKQQFENTFFNMIQLQNQIVNSLSLNNVYSGRAALKYIADQITETIEELKGKGKSKEDIYETVMSTYQSFFEEHEDLMGHYMRHLYRIVKFIVESKLTNAERRNYFGILRAQWSKSEFLLIYLNLFSEDGPKFKQYVKIYDVMDIEKAEPSGEIKLKETVPFDSLIKFFYENNL